jgi:hypothetical protein
MCQTRLPIEQRPRFGLFSKGNDDVYNFTTPRKVSLIKNYCLGFLFYINNCYICKNSIKLNTMSKKITREELVELTKAHEEYYTSKDELANILIAEERTKTQKQLSLMNFSEKEEQVQLLMGEINKKYGEGKVNLTTGEIS